MPTVYESYGDVMVLGGGISGIQAALDLATAGFKVFLVEKAPTIGGKMAQLDKTFPTNDCSMCIESPKFIECDRHPNIEILTHTEVEKVEGEAGAFEITLLRKPRYVNEDVCTGCTVCAEYCPVPIPDPFNQQLSTNKAVHIYFSQAVPLVPYIDERCLYLEDEKCSICEGVCENHAIDLRQKPKKQVIKVGAVVLSPGFGAFDPAVRGDYGYGKLQNVVTSSTSSACSARRVLTKARSFGPRITGTRTRSPGSTAWARARCSRAGTATAPRSAARTSRSR